MLSNSLKIEHRSKHVGTDCVYVKNIYNFNISAFVGFII